MGLLFLLPFVLIGGGKALSVVVVLIISAP